MPIQITCPGCHARFQVSDKFAGKTGPCPKCKAQIRIPDKSEEVVIHAPEQFGPKDASGRAVLKPLERKEVRATPLAVISIIGGVLAVLALAFVLGRVVYEGQVPVVLAGLGAVLVAPPLVLSGYSVLRDDELEPYRSGALALRVGICSLAYAALWLGYWWLGNLWRPGPPELFQLVFVVPGLLAVGGLASLATLDLEFGNAVIHCGYYVLVTVLLRGLMGMPWY